MSTTNFCTVDWMKIDHLETNALYRPRYFVLREEAQEKRYPKRGQV